jgi:uncharacterized membrane protein YoaK (UPF0700 family)
MSSETRPPHAAGHDPSALSGPSVPAAAMGQAVLLCAIAGYVDAIGYVTLGHVFPANMTGNTVLVAVAALQSEWLRVANQAVTLAAFFAGAILAHVLGRASGRPALPFLAEAGLLAAVAAAPPPRTAALALLAVAMGLQSGAQGRFGAATLQTVVVTGTMTRLAINLVDAAAVLLAGAGRQRNSALSRQPLPPPLAIYALAWIAYGIGAGIGAAAVRHTSAPLAISAALLVVMTGIGTARRRIAQRQQET